MKITNKEFTELEKFIRHTKRILGTEQKLPMSLKHKTQILEIEFKVKRHGENSNIS